jgi:hypothetical protein
MTTYRQARAKVFVGGYYVTSHNDTDGYPGVVEVLDDGTFGWFAFEVPADDRMSRVVATCDNQGTGPFYSPTSLHLT